MGLLAGPGSITVCVHNHGYLHLIGDQHPMQADVCDDHEGHQTNDSEKGTEYHQFNGNHCFDILIQSIEAPMLTSLTGTEKPLHSPKLQLDTCFHSVALPKHEPFITRFPLPDLEIRHSFPSSVKQKTVLLI